jgi:predicted anti-sigma-YlaC factor YlaD
MTDNTHHPHQCLSQFEKLSQYLDKELDELTCQDIERHVGECIACRVCLETLKRTVMLCHTSEQDQKPVPGDFARRLKETINALCRQPST